VINLATKKCSKQEKFEKYLKRIDEQYNNNSEFEIPFRTRTLDCFGKVKLKEILEEIYDEGVEKGSDMFLVELDR